MKLEFATPRSVDFVNDDLKSIQIFQTISRSYSPGIDVLCAPPAEFTASGTYLVLSLQKIFA